jgi:hypothetical protein
VLGASREARPSVDMQETEHLEVETQWFEESLFLDQPSPVVSTALPVETHTSL